MLSYYPMYAETSHDRLYFAVMCSVVLLVEETTNNSNYLQYVSPEGWTFPFFQPHASGR